MTITPEQNLITYSLPIFEGPLDLLLTLIAKNKINIYEIEINILIEQYLEKVQKMQEAQMEVAAEFLEMATRLLYIKSAMLLPKYEDEAEDLKKELTGQLIEYKICKEMAKKFSKIVSFDAFVRETDKIDFDFTYNRIHEQNEIMQAYLNAIGKGRKNLPPQQEAFSGIVKKKIISVSSKVVFVLRKLWKNDKIKYNEIFEESTSKSELVATFLAVLELVKSKRVKINGKGENAEIYKVNKS